jgi:hypothetical protein
MDFRRVATGWFRTRRKLKVAEARKPRKNRTGTFSAVTLGAAAIAFLLALFGVGPFAVQTLVIDFGPGNSAPLAASAVFPSVSPVQKIVNVYESPRPRAPAPLPRPASSPSSHAQPSQSPSPRPTDN